MTSRLQPLATEGEFASTQPSIRDAACTDIGFVRARNEDAFVRRSDERLWAVADGMGGHEGGAWASEVIARSINSVPLQGRLDPDASALEQAIEAANWTIYARGAAQGVRIGSTVVALLLRPERFAVAWAGDSRAYLLRGGELVQLTRDHSQVQDRVDRGLVSREEARRHPMSHVLTRAVGVQPSLRVDWTEDAAMTGDLFLLCSDGVHGVLSDDEIATTLSEAPPESACERLLELCRLRGAPDNATLVVVACDEACA